MYPHREAIFGLNIVVSGFMEGGGGALITLICCNMSNNIVITTTKEALRYKPAGRGFDSRWCH